MRENSRRIQKRKFKGEMLEPCSRRWLERESRDKRRIEQGEEGKKVEELESNDGFEFPGIPLVPSHQNTRPGIIFVLEKASLSLAFVGKRYQIINPDEHADFLRKKKLDPYMYRPDIIHEALLQIKNSRLHMAGMVQALYVKTDEGVLIKVEPHTNIPDSLEEFCAMMSELLQKFSIKAKGRHGMLLQVIKNPVTKYLPVNSHKIGLSFSSQKMVELQGFVNAIGNELTLVFVVGTMAHGKIDNEYIDDFISVSSYPLSADVCLFKICNALERKFKIL